jgi:butyrate kinase
MKSAFRILTINVGSTSTKVGLFADETPLFKETVNHTKDELSQSASMREMLSFRQRVIDRVLAGHPESEQLFDLIVSRGGLTHPLKSGPYLITDAMCQDLSEATYGWHPTNVGPLIANQIGKERGGVPAIISDSPVTDEMEPIAKISGLKEVVRKAAFHVLNQKSAARKAAGRFGKAYEAMNFIVCHLGGGITICAHRQGRIIDGTHGLSEGPFTPQRSGSLPWESVIDLSFSGRFTKDELKNHFLSHGGLVSYLGTHDIKEIERKIKEGDKEAYIIIQAMCYQASKDIGAMASVLKGKIDAVVLTGNLCYSTLIVNEITSAIGFLAPLDVVPGEDELENLALNGLEVLRSKGLSAIQEY